MTNEPAGQGPVDQTVGPWGWHAGDGTPAHPDERVAQWPAHNRGRMQHVVYDQSALDAAVAAERERWQRIARTAQNVTTGCTDKIDYFELPSHLMAALALALDEGPNLASSVSSEPGLT